MRKKRRPRKLKVGLLFGGRSAEHEVSIRSARAIFDHLDPEKHSVTSVFIDKKGLWRVVPSPHEIRKSPGRGDSSFSFLPWAGRRFHLFLKADIYFPVLHGPYGEDGTIQGLFEMADVPYVGAGVTASAVGMDKAIMKTLFKENNLPVVKFRIFGEPEWKRKPRAVLDEIQREFRLPVFTKPANLGSSIGITKVKEWCRAADAIRTAFLYDRKILIEEGIQGREFECSVLGNDNPRASLPGEIIPFREFYDYRDKYLEDKTAFGIPADVPQSLSEEIQRISVKAFQAIDCSGMARVDFFFQTDARKLYLNEINTIPGFTSISMYPKLWETSGLSFDRLVEELIALGLDKHRRKKRRLTRMA